MTEEVGSKKVKKKLGKVGRKEIAKGLAHMEGLSKTQSERIIDLVFRQIKYLVIEKNIVEIPGFGRFFAKYVGPRVGSHPQTHEKIEIEPRVQMRAEFSNTVKKSLNNHISSFRQLMEDENGEEKPE